MAYWLTNCILSDNWEFRCGPAQPQLVTTDHFVRIITVDNVCMHYFPFTFSECPIGNDIFGMPIFWTIEVANLWMATTKCIYGLFWMTFCVYITSPFCMQCCTNFLIHYCNGNPLYIDNFYIAKLIPSPNPCSIGLLYFHLILPPTHRPDQPPTCPEKFLRHN